MKFELGPGVRCDLQTLIDTRALVQANSGGGKSHTLHRLLEQTHGRVQQLVIDPEGEFASLRERYDYVLAAKSGGDTAADPRGAKLLAERLLELGVSAILDIYELKAHERIRFVRAFLEALVDAPKTLWHPALVVLDEAHVYCMDTATEILTVDGWVSWQQAHPDQEVVAFDLATETYRHEPIQRVITRHHSGDMVRLATKALDCLVTPDHRVVVQRVQRARGRAGKVYPWSFCPADRTPTHIRVPAGGGPGGSGIPGLSVDICRIIGWLLTDGYNAAADGALGLQQAVGTRKYGRSMIGEMDRVLRRALGPVSRYERPARDRSGPSIAYYIPAAAASSLTTYVGTALALKADRRVPRSLIVETNREQRHALFQGLLEGDGGTSFYPGHAEGLADDFQELATRLGVSTVKGFVESVGQWHVSLSKRRHHEVRAPTRDHYDGIVWDITVASGAFVARRNGRVFVTGNCPQQGEAESAGAVIDLCTRGRKRGFSAILATQRLSKLHKDAAAELNNKLIGRTGLDVDRKRAGEELGFTTKEQMLSLRQLEPGHFYAFGPALSLEVVQVQVGPVQTTHPKAGSRIAFTPPPPTDKVKALLPQLADLPAEAEQRQKTEAELKKDLATARATITRLERAAPLRVETKVETQVERVMVPMLTEQHLADLKAAADGIRLGFGGVRGVLDSITRNGELLKDALHRIDVAIAQATKPQLAPVQTSAGRPREVPVRVDRAGRVHARVLTTAQRKHTQIRDREGEFQPSRAQQRILDALAWLESVGVAAARKTQLALLAEQSPTSSGYTNSLGALRTAGLVAYPSVGAVALTEDGRALAQAPDRPPTTEALHEALYGRLSNAQGRILRALITAYPESMSKGDLAAAADQSPTSSGYTNNLGSLRSLGFIDYPGPGLVVALPVLFFEGAA